MDSVPLLLSAWKRVGERHDLPFDEADFLRANGRRGPEIIQKVYRWTRSEERTRELLEEKERIFAEEVETRGLRPIPGVVEWLENLQRAQIPCAVATSASRETLRKGLENTGLAHYFRAFVAQEDVTQGKPNPEVFLRAAELLGVHPSQCVVFEDSPLGVEAAKRAKMRCCWRSGFGVCKGGFLPDVSFSDYAELGFPSKFNTET